MNSNGNTRSNQNNELDLHDGQEEKDLTGFDKNVMDLFDVCKSILKVSDKRNLSFSDRKNPYLNRLEKYMKIYSGSDPAEHVVYFSKIYSNNKRFILLGPQRDSWLSDGKLIISFGEDCGIKTEMKLHLSGIYLTAVKIRDELKEELTGLPMGSTGNTESVESGYPMAFMLILYRIFFEITNSDVEKTKLMSHIESMEGETGNRSTSGNSNADPLAGLLDMASNMAEQVSGNKIPKDKLPGKNDFSKMISSVIDNPKTKSMLGNMMQEFQKTNNLGEMVTKLVGSLSGGQPSDGTSTPLSGPSSGPSSGPQGVEVNTSSASTASTTSGTQPSVNDEFDDY
jgi:hypothetical protein